MGNRCSEAAPCWCTTTVQSRKTEHLDLISGSIALEDVIIVLAKDSFNRWQEASTSKQLFSEISPKFKHLVDKAMEDMQPRSRCFVQIDDIDIQTLNILINYSLGAEIDIEFDFSLIRKLRKIARSYQIEELVFDIDQIILSTLSFQNFCHVYKFCSGLKDPILLQSCLNHLQYLTGDPNDVLRSKKFVELKFYPDLQLLTKSLAFMPVDADLLWSRCKEWSHHHSDVGCRQIKTFLNVSFSNVSCSDYAFSPLLEGNEEGCAWIPAKKDINSEQNELDLTKKVPFEKVKTLDIVSIDGKGVANPELIPKQCVQRSPRYRTAS